MMGENVCGVDLGAVVANGKIKPTLRSLNVG